MRASCVRSPRSETQVCDIARKLRAEFEAGLMKEEKEEVVEEKVVEEKPKVKHCSTLPLPVSSF